MQLITRAKNGTARTRLSTNRRFRKIHSVLKDRLTHELQHKLAIICSIYKFRGKLLKISRRKQNKRRNLFKIIRKTFVTNSTCPIS